MESDRRVCIYPCYLNKELKLSQGRQIPKKAVVRTGGKNACNRNKNGILVWRRRRGVPISLHADAHGKFGFCLVACENPTTPEIFDCVVQGLKLPAEIERKRHPRDWKYLGRVRVQLKDDTGKLLNAEVPSRRILMMRIAELVPRHPGRTAKAIATGAGGSSSGSSGPKKSGKKKK